LLEIRRDPEKAKDCAGTIFSSIVLGGIAAVAILYFFPPEETVSTTVKGVTTVVKEYNLTKLVALALIVGSAGASFLLVLQKRTMDLADAQEEAAKSASDKQAIQAQANEAIVNVGSQAKLVAKSSAVESSAPAIQKAVKRASAGKATGLGAEALANAVGEVGDQAQAAAESVIDPLVKEAQDRLLSLSSEEPEPKPSTD
jgi:hypothetical protein